MLRLLLGLLLLAPSAWAGRSTSKAPAIPARGAEPAVSIAKTPLPAPIAQPAAMLKLPASSLPIVQPAAQPKTSAPAFPAASAARPLASLDAEIAQSAAKPQAPVQAATDLSSAFSRRFDNAARLSDLDQPEVRGSPRADQSSGLSPPRPSAQAQQRRLEDIERLRVGTYNVLNLFEKVGKWVPDPRRPGKMIQILPRQAKAEWQLRESAKAIKESGLDVIVLQEVENIQALRMFNERYLGGEYRALLIEGNDERGIDVGFLVKKDIPFEIEHRTHKDETWDDPVWGGRRKLFSRDLPSVVVRAPGRAEPLFVMFGTHFKSKRDRDDSDPESRGLRKAQVERAAEIVGRYREEFGADVPILLAGDFNGEMNKEPEFEALRRAAKLVDSLDLVEPPLSEVDRITHTYHPRGAKTKKHQMDAIMVSERVGKLVTTAWVYRYRDENGNVKPIPETYKEREKNPSDHYPVVMELQFQPLLSPRVEPAVTRPANAQAPSPQEAPAPPDVRMVADQNYLAQALDVVNSARETLDVFAFSARYAGAAKTLIDAVIEAKRLNPRLRARFFMEGARSTGAANRKTARRLENAGVEVMFGDTHAKGLIADGRQALVGSTNLTHTSIELNNETNFLVNDPEAVAALSQYYEKRWRSPGEFFPFSFSFADGRLKVVTDGAYRAELLDMIRTSRKSLDISIYYLQLLDKNGSVLPDMKEIADALIEAREKRGVEIRIYLEQNGNGFAPGITRENRRSAKFLRRHGIKAYFDLADQISHSKYVIRDGEEVMAGTGNFNPADFADHHQVFLRVKDAGLSWRMTAHHSAKIAYASDRPAAERPYIRFWLGWIKPELEREEFDRAIDNVFVDATIETGRARGLSAYLPVLTRDAVLTRNGRTFAVPAEVAAVIYDDPETYRAIRETPRGQVYGPLHGDFFDVTGQSGNRSQSAVPEDYAGRAQVDRAYDLSVPGVNWQRGVSHFSLSLRPDGVSVDAYLSGVKAYLDAALERRESLGLKGLAVHVTENYLVEYSNFEDERSYASGIGVLQALKNAAGAFDPSEWQSSRVAAQPEARTSIRRGSDTAAISVIFPQDIDRAMIKRTNLETFLREPDLVKIKEEFLEGRR